MPNKFPCRPVNVGFGLSNPIFLSSMSSRISPSSWQPDFVCQQNKTLIWIYWSQIHKTKDKKPNSKFFWLTFQLFDSNAGQKQAEGWFLSKWVYNFWPAKILYACQDIHIGGGQLFLAASCTFFVPSKNSIRIWVFFDFKHHIGGGQQQKWCTKSSKP